MSVLPFASRLPAFAPIHPLGRGPLGEWVSLVWPLEQGQRGEHPLVVKTYLLASGLGPETRLPLEEALTQAVPLRHPGIARLHGFQVDARDTLTVVSDYVPGCSLATARRRVAGRGARLSEAFVCHVGAEVAGALHAAHVTRVVHGDVRANRIRLGPRGEVTLTDFGLRPACRLLRRFASPIRPDEVAPPPVPEEAVDAPLEAHADLRALGRVLLELVTGRAAVSAPAEVEAGLRELSPAPREVLGRLLFDAPRQEDTGARLQADLRACCHAGAEVVREVAALPGAGPLSPVDVYVGAASVMTASVPVRARALKS
ncbi:protein kinase family protein [Corallococcus praedator]|uniref:non-specific serine/threonine protein kinase n=1 Tax=Corallococcus praedator TaxID=2316724 RepID=A0ABX9Q9F1_9BACT|nr:MULTISPECIES: protein kinase [Corallococcus]RKH96777.1 protein kinase family protein [Corallococcus praedator]